MLAAMPYAGQAAFDAGNPNTSNLLLYKFADDNWAGIGVSPSGVPILKFGVNSTQLYTFNYDGIYLNNNKIAGNISRGTITPADFSNSPVALHWGTDSCVYITVDGTVVARLEGWTDIKSS